MKTKRLSLSFLAFAVLCAPLLQAKPLKVFKAFADALAGLKKP